MNQQNLSRRVAWLVVAAVALTVWGIIGIVQRRDLGRGGYFYGPDYIVSSVSPEGAGAKAGIQVGDRVLSVGGIPVQELPMQSRWTQPRVGESLLIEVERNGESVAIEVVYGRSRLDPVVSGLRTLMVGLSFLGLGLWAYVRAPTRHAWTVALMGLAMALSVVRGPHLGAWDGVASHINIASAVLFVALLLHFLLTFPQAGRFGGSRQTARLIYGVWLLYVAFLVVELIVHPALYAAYGFLGFMLLLAYGVLVLATAIHAFVKTRRIELRESGLGVVLLGLLVAIVPNLAYVAVRIFLPGITLPAPSYVTVLLIAIPLTLVIGVRKQAFQETQG